MATTYQYEFVDGSVNRYIVIHQINNANDTVIYTGDKSSFLSEETQKQNAINSLQFQYPGIGGMTLRYAPLQQTQATPPTPTPAANTQVVKTDKPQNRPFDNRLVFAIAKDSGTVVYSLDSDNQHPLIDGMIFNEGGVLGSPSSKKVVGHDLDDSAAQNQIDFFGVPSIMNPNSYINLQAAGGKGGNKYLIDRENQIRWYNATEGGEGDGSGPQASTTPSVPEIIKWSLQENNMYKFPYRYTDFVFCKWWKKIPNNYMITLRRYPFPTNDGVTSSEEVQGKIELTNLKPVSTMITFLGEESGNKISSIVGPIETGLLWKDLEAKVWEVSIDSAQAGDVNNPAPSIGKFLGFLTSGGEGVKTGVRGPTPPDPYQGGPYQNKILGPINVITKTKMRDQGLMFKHEIALVFEYSLRSIGGINTKVAALDILSNTMLMSTASASFWGGANRFAPNAGYGTADPFLGGPAGKAAWMQGNPDAFFKALQDQFTKIGKNISDVFGKIFQSIGGGDPLSGLANLAKGGFAEYMKMTTAHAKQQITGLHSLLTGAPIGEWHLTVGPPMNPIMMMGNMICTGCKVEFNDELGPDDFPTEMKITITLQHGMERDRDAIESMFNKGRGRIYSLPKGYENSFASSSQSPIDAANPSKYSYQANLNPEGRNGPWHANKDAAAARRVDLYSTEKQPTVGSTYGALYSQGYGYSPKATETEKTSNS